MSGKDKKKGKKKDKNDGKLSNKEYEKEMEKLQGELVKLQRWVVAKKKRVLVVFEGRDAAGKGGVIKRITERVSPRVFRTVALPAPNEREKTQLYIQRYLQHFPSGGEIALFDRSWYNRAGVERVMGFASKEQVLRFLQYAPIFEQMVVEGGVQLIKYWFDVSMDVQEERFRSRITDPRKTWKLSPMDVESYQRWYDYSRARDDMLMATDRDFAPWHVVRADSKKKARLNCISHLLSQIPYEDIPLDEVELGKRDKSDAYDDGAALEGKRFIPEKF
jgi:polyphosphate kinase 2